MVKRKSTITKVLIYVFFILSIVLGAKYLMNNMEGMRNRNQSRNANAKRSIRDTSRLIANQPRGPTPQSERNNANSSKVDYLNRENSKLKKQLNSMNQRIRRQNRVIRDQKVKLKSMVGSSK